ncbi:Amino-acid permease BAT1 [Dichanthelium oligosanthes]|uniref:Amino-acid permease BAT1 n=1 Tax=Dichanthelium oligosanthes TaxID=888268 RepID=A0A1E5VM76_9POAL|nr:Amino-acid permease BAT1 [Dichanthelium oligosanthes]
MSPRSAAELPVADPAVDPDRARLQQLGYKQELKRGLSLLSNFAFSFSIISVLAGVTTTYNTGLRYGGPASMTLGWLVVAAFNGCVALSMAEICSAYPTSGGLYYWSAKLAGKEWAPLASWVTGWFNIVGQSEETKNAAWSGPMGIVVSVALSSVFGWIYLVALTSIVTNIPSLLDPSNDAGGNAIAQALYTIFQTRFGSGAGGIVCLAAMAVAIFLCGTASVTSNSRMGYAFSRDGAMPFSRVWYRVNKQEVPFNVVWLSVSVAFVMALTSLGSQVAFQAMVSITTLGMYIAYALPIFFRVTAARRSFVPGPFHLGRYGVAVGWVGVLWVALVTVLFCLPVAYPVVEANFNYTPVAVGGVLLLSLAAWALHARFWFRGPVTNVDA